MLVMIRAMFTGKFILYIFKNKYRWIDERETKLAAACSWGMEHSSVQQDWSSTHADVLERGPSIFFFSPYHSYALRRLSQSALRRTDGHLLKEDALVAHRYRVPSPSHRQS